MKIKQTIKKISVLFLGVSVFVMFAFGTIPVNAASCGGVTTSVISCTQSLCAGGEQAYEGVKPTSTTAKADYLKNYGHNYGLCKNDVKPATGDLSSNGVWGLLLIAINILTAGVGIAAIGGIVSGSILYTSAGGSPEQVKKAMGIITNVVIGIIAYALMFSLLNFLIPGGLFN